MYLHTIEKSLIKHTFEMTIGESQFSDRVTIYRGYTNVVRNGEIMSILYVFASKRHMPIQKVAYN